MITQPESLPWKVRVDNRYGMLPLIDIVGCNGETICEFNGDKTAADTKGAAYIVHAAKLYPALVKLLTAIRADASVYQWHKSIDAALTQAREPDET